MPDPSSAEPAGSLADPHFCAILTRADGQAGFTSVARAVVHELRNPLQAVVLAARCLAAGPTGGSAQRMVGILSRETDRLERLMQAFASMVRCGDAAAGECRLETVVQNVVALQDHRPEGGAAIRVAVPEGLPPVLADPGQLQHALLNLIINAREATTAEGEIRITAAGRANGVELAVEDDGPGIPEPLRGLVFEPFVTTKWDGERLGLGLTVARLLVGRWGGAVWAESREDRRGARLVVRLPAAC